MSTEPQDIADLLTTDRELSPQERTYLSTVGERTWDEIATVLATRARTPYTVVSTDTFAHCVRDHLDAADRVTLVISDVYQCPVCSTMLKDRTLASTGVLVERGRLRQMWLEVEESDTDQEFTQRIRRFRAALGLS